MKVLFMTSIRFLHFIAGIIAFSAATGFAGGPHHAILLSALAKNIPTQSIQDQLNSDSRLSGTELHDLFQVIFRDSQAGATLWDEAQELQSQKHLGVAEAFVKVVAKTEYRPLLIDAIELRM